MICFRRILIQAIIIFSVCQAVHTQSPAKVFDHLTTNNGLSHNTVRAICQDSEGFMWIGTADGLNRYDGINFREYRNSPRRMPQHTSPVLIDSAENVWFGRTPAMLCKRSGSYMPLYTIIDDTLEIIETIYDMAFGPDNKIYLALSKNIVAKKIYDTDSVCTEINLSLPDPTFNRISQIGFDTDTNLWIGTDQGFFVVSPGDTLGTYFNSIKYPEQKYVTEFMFDTSGNMWVIFTTELLKYDFKHGTTERYRLPVPGNPVLTVISQTKNGTVWVGTWEQGLYYLDPEDLTFKCFLDDIGISCVYEDRSGRVWIGTHSSGIFVYDPLMNYFSQLPVTPGKKTIKSFQCDIMLNDKDKGLWIGARSYGLLYYDFATRITSLIDSTNIMIDVIYQDANGCVWYNHGNYLFCYDPVQKKLIKKVKHPVPNQFPVLNEGNTLTKILSFNNMMIIASDYGQVYAFDQSNDSYRLIYENLDHIIRVMIVYNNRLYICVADLGVLVLDNSFVPVDTMIHRDTDRGLISHIIMAIIKDKYDSLWIGGYGGLSRYNRNTDQFETALSCDDAANYITSVLEDDAGNMWMGSARGIIKYERASNRFILFDLTHGVPPGRFFVSSVAKTVDGMMYFGGNNGIVYFRPDQVRTNNEPPPLVLTDFHISGSGKKFRRHLADLDDSINYLKEIHLKYYENSFIIRYAALNFTSPSHNQYKYMLEGLDNDWNYAGNQSQATYTNLNGGEYIFYVNGSNNDGIWSPEPRALTIIVDKPPGKRWWAILFYFLSVSAVFLVIYFYNLRRIRLQHQLDIKNRETESLAEINVAKSRFFTNISHEFRTPLTLILDPANRMLADRNVPGSQKNLLRLITNNAERLISLVNQILDLSRLKNGQLSLHAEPVDFRDFIMPIYSSFKSRAEVLNLEYEIVFKDDGITLWIDREKMRYVITNIISNAFKFCPNGKITVEVSQSAERIIIKISDTGIGIPADEIDKVFNEYYQVKTPYHRNLAGSGIGLALVREYMNLHHGTVDVQSEENKGTTFTLSLLSGNLHFNNSEINHQDSSQESVPNQICQTGEVKTAAICSTVSVGPKYTILLVEDDIDITRYLSDALSGKYNIISSVNGAEGLKKMLKYLPDIVVSDIMMPVMDGYTFCERVKQDERISHIPVILLTARVEYADRIKGLSLGADDYLAKPFSLDELELRIKNHIERFLKLQALFLKDFKLKSNDEIRLSLHDKFLRKVFLFIEKHYKDSQFGVEKLSEQMAMNRSHLSRKIKKMTNESPNELVRNYRLRIARSLLTEKDFNVTEACFASGFNNLSYFSKCFFQYYGQHPSESAKFN